MKFCLLLRIHFTVKGWTDELLAIRKINDKYLVAVYKELENDDFALSMAKASHHEVMCI